MNIQIDDICNSYNRERKISMREIMRIGDEFVVADNDIKDISKAGTEITDIAQRYKTDVLAVICKGDKHSLVTQYHEKDTAELSEDIVKAVSLVYTIADTYSVNAIDVAEMIKIIIEEHNKER